MRILLILICVALCFEVIWALHIWRLKHIKACNESYELGKRHGLEIAQFQVVKQAIGEKYRLYGEMMMNVIGHDDRTRMDN